MPDATTTSGDTRVVFSPKSVRAAEYINKGTNIWSKISLMIDLKFCMSLAQ